MKMRKLQISIIGGKNTGIAKIIAAKGSVRFNTPLIKKTFKVKKAQQIPL